MTNGEYVTTIVEQDIGFCILTDVAAGTVTINIPNDRWTIYRSN